MEESQGRFKPRIISWAFLPGGVNQTVCNLGANHWPSAIHNRNPISEGLDWEWQWLGQSRKTEYTFFYLKREKTPLWKVMESEEGHTPFHPQSEGTCQGVTGDPCWFIASLTSAFFLWAPACLHLALHSWVCWWHTEYYLSPGLPGDALGTNCVLRHTNISESGSEMWVERCGDHMWLTRIEISHGKFAKFMLVPVTGNQEKLWSALIEHYCFTRDLVTGNF